MLADFIPIVFLIALGAFWGHRGTLSDEMVAGLKKIITTVALPALLFVAFTRVSTNLSLALLFLVVYLSCGLMGLAAVPIAALFRLPRPSTVYLFQGFEAGMLGYTLFTGVFGRSSLAYFATADLGQVIFVFTMLMTQLRRPAQGGPVQLSRVLRDMAGSPIVIAIAAGLLSAAINPGALGSPWGTGGVLVPLLDTVGSLTTPLVCLVVGFSLKDFTFRGAVPALVASLLRLGLATALGSLVAFVVVPALGYGRLQSVAVLAMFILPPPFVIPVFRTEPDDAAYVGSVLSIHTILSILAFLVLAAVFAAGGGTA